MLRFDPSARLNCIVALAIMLGTAFGKAEFANAEDSIAANTVPAKAKLDLKDTVRYGVENSPSFDSIKRQLRISVLEEQSSKARLLPSLDLTATHGLLDRSPRLNNNPYDSEFNLALTESLYDNGVLWTNRRVATLNRRQQELRAEDQKNQVSLDVATQYLLFSLNVKLQDIRERQFNLVKKQYSMISKGYYHGIKTKNDYLRFKTEVSRNEIDLVNSKNTVEKSKIELRRLIGVPFTTSNLNEANVDFIPYDFGSENNEIPVLNFNLESHLQYKAAQLQKQINELNSSLIARKTLPEVYLSAGANYASSNYLGTSQTFKENGYLGWNALITVKYNFFDWGIRSRDREVAGLRNRIQSNELDNELLALKSTITQLELNLQQIKRTFELAKELLSLERSNISFIEREYQNGKIQYLDLITGLNNLADAEIKFYSAVSDLQTARYTLLRHQGLLYDEILK